MSSKGFIAPRGDYRNLASYQVADCVYAMSHKKALARGCYYGIPSTREIKCHIKNDYLDRLPERSDETIANIALTLIHQYEYIMVKLIESIKRRFLEQGGIKEQMYKARLEQRDRQREVQSSRSSQSSLPGNKPNDIIN